MKRMEISIVSDRICFWFATIRNIFSRPLLNPHPSNKNTQQPLSLMDILYIIIHLVYITSRTVFFYTHPDPYMHTRAFEWLIYIFQNFFFSFGSEKYFVRIFIFNKTIRHLPTQYIYIKSTLKYICIILHLCMFYAMQMASMRNSKAQKYPKW